jgi:hypothetical protein
VAHWTARTVSAARGGAIGCCSMTVVVPQPGSRHRQILVSHRTTETRPRHGASCSTRQRRPCPTASTPAAGAAIVQLVGLDRRHQPLLTIDVDIEDVHAGEHRTWHRPGRTSAHPNHTYSGSPSGLRRREAWSLPILKVPTPSTHDQHAVRVLLTHAHLGRAGYRRYPWIRGRPA